MVGGTFVYIHFIESDPPPPLTFASVPASSAAARPIRSSPGGVDGTWKATDASVAGYRVKEVLFGQDNEAAGRTECGDR